MIISMFLIALCMGGLPYLLGLLYTRFVTEEKNHIFLNLTAGYMIAWGLFQVVTLPLIAARASFSTLFYLYGGILLLLAVVSLILNYKRIGTGIMELIRAVPRFGLAVWLECALILAQILMYIRYSYSNADDAFFVASANTSLTTNTVFAVNPYTGDAYANLPSRYVLSPFHAFIAVVSKAIHQHPAIVAHSVFMIVFLLVAYAVYTLIARLLFQKDMEKTGFFLILLSALNIYAAYSERTSGLFFLVRLWQGKAILAAILLPFIFYMAMRIFLQKGKLADWILLGFTMASCCMVSSMGIMLGPIAIGLLGLLYAASRRSIRILIGTGLICIPNMICVVLYLMIR